MIEIRYLRKKLHNELFIQKWFSRQKILMVNTDFNASYYTHFITSRVQNRHFNFTTKDDIIKARQIHDALEMMQAPTRLKERN